MAKKSKVVKIFIDKKLVDKYKDKRNRIINNSEKS